VGGGHAPQTTGRKDELTRRPTERAWTPPAIWEVLRRLESTGCVGQRGRWAGVVTPNNPAYFSFFGLVTEGRAVHFKETFKQTLQDASRATGAPDHAYILFHSCGGEAKPALDLHAFLKQHSDHVTAVNVGYVCSAALTMFLAIPCDRRLMAEHAVFMCHDIVQKIEGDPTDAELAEFSAVRAEDSRAVRDLILRETGLSSEEWDCASEHDLEIWRDRDDAVEGGFVSRVGGFRLPKEVSITEL